MEEKKWVIPAKDALKMLKGIIRFTYITKMMGMKGTSGWLYGKMYETPIGTGKKLHFSKYNAYMLGETLQAIGNGLRHSVISKSPEYDPLSLAKGETEREQLVNLGKVVCLPYIYETRMKKTYDWFSNRKKGGVKGGFKEEELAMINMIIQEIATTILSMKLTV